MTAGLLVFAVVTALADVAGELQELPFHRRGRTVANISATAEGEAASNEEG